MVRPRFRWIFNETLTELSVYATTSSLNGVEYTGPMQSASKIHEPQPAEQEDASGRGGSRKLVGARLAFR